MPPTQPSSSLRTRAQRSTRQTPASSGSQTITSTSTSTSSQSTRLILRGHADAAPPSSATPPSRVQWADDVIDNEGLGRKSSKVCCIYHKPHDPEAESGSDSSSSESSGESSGEDMDRASVRRSRARRRQGRKDGHGNGHEHGEECSRDHDHEKEGGSDDGDGNGGKGKGKKIINAYERMPRYTEAGRKQAGHT